MSKHVLSEELAKLPHRAKVAFAVRCVRIAWELLPQAFRRNAPPEFAEALSIAERSEDTQRLQAAIAKDSSRRTAAESLIVAIPQVLAHDSKPGSIAEAILFALDFARAANVDDPESEKAKQATARAHRAFDEARHIVKDAAEIHAPGTNIERGFLEQATKALKRLLKNEQLMA
jgi:hypothetical protein